MWMNETVHLMSLLLSAKELVMMRVCCSGHHMDLPLPSENLNIVSEGYEAGPKWCWMTVNPHSVVLKSDFHLWEFSVHCLYSHGHWMLSIGKEPEKMIWPNIKPATDVQFTSLNWMRHRKMSVVSNFLVLFSYQQHSVTSNNGAINWFTLDFSFSHNLLNITYWIRMRSRFHEKLEWKKETYSCVVLPHVGLLTTEILQNQCIDLC